MKKYLIAFIVIFALSNCEVKVKETKAQDKFPVYTLRNSLPYGINGKSKLNVTVYERDGIEYRIFSNNAGYNGQSIFVVNHTKELLEVEYLKKQLSNQ